MPDIVYVDDDPSGFLAISKEAKARISAFIFDETKDLPAEALATAMDAKVWLFDFFLIQPAGDGADENGLSLFQKWKAVASGRPTTVVVSSDLGKALGESLGPLPRHHVVAQRQGVEWIGDKSEETLQRILALADAAATIAAGLQPSKAEDSKGTYDAQRLSFDVLGVPKGAEWANSAQRQVDRARPPREVPISSDAATARGIIGWLLAHVLPYPSFLLTDAQAALRLRIAPESFRMLADLALGSKKGHYRERIAAALYGGPLSTFLGRRWWRAAIDDVAWHLSQDEADFRPALEQAADGTPIVWLDQGEPVLISDADLVETDEVADASECVRVSDEDFPANVDPAWVRIASARENRQLAAKVVYEDRELLSPAE